MTELFTPLELDRILLDLQEEADRQRVERARRRR